MNRGELRKAEELFSPKDIASFAERLCKKNGFDPEKWYPQTTESAVMPSVARRILYVGNTVNLLRRAVVLGATDIEVNNIAEHLMVLMESVDKKLNYEQSYIDHGISNLKKKYSADEYCKMAADLTLHDFEEILKKDSGYFGVSLKCE